MREEFIVYGGVVPYGFWLDADGYEQNGNIISFTNMTADSLKSGIRLLESHKLMARTNITYKIKEVYLW